MKKLISMLGIIGVLIFAGLILKNPEICKNGAISGILLCGQVIIPSLFPFTFCVLFILKSGILNYLKFPEPLSVFILSLVGGYPLGAKMLSLADIDRKTASVMLNFCVNAGPAFIILAVGNGIFGSQKIGIILFISHILPPIFLALFCRKRLFEKSKNTYNKPINIIDNFVISATESCSALINICTFVILFSVLTAYLNAFSEIFEFLKPFALILEVTNGIAQCRNIYLISALLGFGGICIWCQVFSFTKSIKINYLKFALCRIFHAISSTVFTYFFIKIFKITLPALSNGKVFNFSAFSDGLTVGISLLVMGIVFIISLSNKNYTGNLLEDIV